MPVIREAIKEYDALIIQAEALKDKIITFRSSDLTSTVKQSRTLQLLESASDHIVDNLKRLRQRIVTDLQGD